MAQGRVRAARRAVSGKRCGKGALKEGREVGGGSCAPGRAEPRDPALAEADGTHGLPHTTYKLQGSGA